jgi:hypothetical protein
MTRAAFASSRTLNFWMLAAFCASVTLACQKTDDVPPAQATYPAPSAAAPVQQAPGYGDGTMQQAVAATATAAAPAVASAGALSQPGPLALPCQSDAQCLTHHCNVAAGKCAWPCQTDNDCMPGNRCIAPTCLPKLQ